MAVAECCHLLFQHSLSLVVELLSKLILLPLLVLQLKRYPCTQREYLLGERWNCLSLAAIGVLVEILKVATPVEDVEELLVVPWSEYVFRQSRASTNHLHKLDFALHYLEEHQVKHIGNIDASIEHIHTDGYLWITVTNLELVDEIFAVGDIVIDKGTELAALACILGI